MRPTRFSSMLLRLPVLEAVVTLLGVYGLAGALENTGFEDADWRNRNVAICGFLACLIPAACDNVPRVRRGRQSALLLSVGLVSLVVFFGFRGDAPVFGLVIFWLIGVAVLLSAVLQSIRGGLAAPIDYQRGSDSQAAKQNE